VVQQQVPAGAQTTLAFKVEQSKVPEFFGQKGKDTITAIVSIRRIDDLARTNNWSDTVTYTNVANTLRGFAHDWLFTTVEMLDWEGDQLIGLISNSDFNGYSQYNRMINSSSMASST